MSPPVLSDEDVPMTSIVRRDRSYSDAHALMTGNSSPSNKPPDISMGVDKATNCGSGSPTRMMGSMKKRHSHQNQHGNRPRSKSLDLHKLHKKKVHQHVQHAKHHVMSHSPHGGAGRYSPSSPKLTGKCWVRKASNAASPTAFIPTLASGPLARSPTTLTHRENEHYDLTSPTQSDPASTSPTRQVTTKSLLNTNSFDDEQMLLYPSRNSLSFETFEHSCEPQPLHIPQRTSWVYGETGKPIQPRSAFEQYTSSSAPSAAAAAAPV